jgi:hypothetical protein
MPTMAASRSIPPPPNGHCAALRWAGATSYLPGRNGGELAAAMYSLISTAKLNGVDPEARLRHVPKRIADRPVN